MNTQLEAAVLLGGTAATGLVAGLFLAFSTAVMPGLARAGDRTFVETMQTINVAILNPVFLVVFCAPLVLLGVATLGDRARLWVIAALVLYVVCFAITRIGNIPLNDALAGAGLPEDPAAITAAREAFESRWNRLHLVRTLAVIASFGCCLGAVWAA